jgi:predicted ATPase/DNA-binding SARP family transcriptional activator
MRYGLLGAMEVRADDGTPVTIAAPKRRALLAALLLEANRPVSADRLAEALWGPNTPPAATASLHAHVSRLRRELGRDRVVTAPAGYLIHVGEDDLDIRVFERRLADARLAAEAGRWDAASSGFASAVGLWRGRALADFVDDDFARPAIVRLEELRLATIEDRIDADLELGRHAEVTAELEALVVIHPFRERFWRQLMLALYRSGRQADALAAFRRLRAGLVEELGVDPSPDVAELEVRILRQDPSLAGPPGGPSQPPIRLPLALTSLVGRRGEIEQAVGILRTNRLLTLTGPGGVGKTRLGILVAHALVGDHPDGVIFVDLSPVRDPSLVPARIGAATGGGERPWDVIGERRMLLVLDNFEQVIEAAVAVADMLGRCPALRVLVTSRTPLRVRGEHRMEVPPLGASEAASLFEDRASAAILSARFEPALVDEIVARLDGLPLAIELAAARINVLSPPALRDRLAERLSLLTTGPRDAPVRQRTLRETIGWSHDLLRPASQAAFRRLSVLASGFDLRAALTVADTDVDCMADLVDQSLVQHEDGRYAMLETIREYAALQADLNGDTDAARDRHLAHFVALASATSRHTTEGGPLGRNAWIAMCGSERENLHLAFEWAVARDDPDAILRLFRSIGMYWLLVGAIDEGTRWGEAAVEAAARLGANDRRTTALIILSEFPRFSGDPDRALALKREALRLARACGDLVTVTTVLDDIASIHAARGEFHLARQLLAEALAVHDANPEVDRLVRVHTVITMAEVALSEGAVADAERHVEEATALEARLDRSPDWVVDSMCLRGKLLHALGRDNDAVDLFRSVVRDAAEIGFRMPVVDSLDALAAISAPVDPDRAARLLGMSDRLRAEATPSPLVCRIVPLAGGGPGAPGPGRVRTHPRRGPGHEPACDRVRGQSGRGRTAPTILSPRLDDRCPVQ